jgi:hypothetical protein
VSSNERPPARYGKEMGEKITEVQWAALPSVLDIALLAQLFEMSEQGVWARIRKGKIPAYWIANQHIVFRDELRASIETPATRVDVLASYPDILDADDAHRLFERPRITMVEWFAHKRLPGSKDGRSWVVRKRTLRLFLNERSNQPQPQPSRALVPGSEEEELVNAAHALTVPARIDIIRALTPYGDTGAYLSDIIDATNIPVGSMRYHLTALEQFGVIRGDIPEEQRHGRAVRYCVDLTKLGDIFGRVFAYTLS